MLDSIRRQMRRLRGGTSGNATLLFALGLPAMIGGSGLAVDTAQWYMWKRELQFAVDQAALAGAWARTQTASKDLYAARARQEFTSNLSATKDHVSTPEVSLANYSGGSGNSVTVSAEVTRTLPFSSFMTGRSVTVGAYAQAAYSEGASFTSCLVAVDEDDDGAITVSGTSVLTAGCGMAALSTSDQAIIINGNPEINAGWVLSRGGIDDWFDNNTDDEVHEYLEGLQDPFKTLTAPNPVESRTARTYNCVKGSKTTRANVAKDNSTTYTYWKGADYETATQTNYNKQKNPSTSSTSQTYTIVSNETVEGIVVTTTVVWTAVNGSSSNTTWEKATTVTTTNYTNVTSTTTPDLATTVPGTYSGGIKVDCTTIFAPGVYVIDGGGLEISGQYEVTGAGVMFVLKNGAHLKINGGSKVSLTAIQASDLIARGIAEAEANKLAGMLVFEDRNSSGTNQNRLNGNAETVLNGTIYLSKSGIDFSGTASVTSQCLMIAAATITITGTANMTTFCPAGMTEDSVVANEISKVKLVV
ncbi:TadE/TadG family type IV pilus assembly protein [Novosphingobium sp.]|uniref:TadE/TadG family type IV pilus assembly protein n=1 Tax=Novosphingobium sp. TaxID=1874826 RepID=UPI0027364572|nr:TadE/TadG family type IV pilus assembly protein [Novosphingobium sp.]MDP3907506.1 pilus assembly protein [Novosphingobium sp.]